MARDDEIVAAAAAWPGVAAADGELSFGGRRFGRVLADRVEVVLPPRVQAMVVETGRAALEDGRAVRRVRSADDAAEAVELLRLAYERARVAQAVREARGR